MPIINFTDEELLALAEAVRHIDDHERWMFEVMDGENLEKASKKINTKANPIIEKLNKEGKL